MKIQVDPNDPVIVALREDLERYRAEVEAQRTQRYRVDPKTTAEVVTGAIADAFKRASRRQIL